MAVGDRSTLLSDALLRQLIAVGQVDVLVGLPTLDNAATVGEIVDAVQVVFARELLRQRSVLVNSDGGSTDGTPEIIRLASSAASNRLMTVHPLRTVHRVSAPFHGLPGKRSGLRTILAAADLTQARAVAVLDPAGPATTPDAVMELLSPVLEGRTEFLTPRYARHPKDGLLVTQLLRPLVRAAYGVELDEPLGQEFGCTGRFATWSLAQPGWVDEPLRAGIDLWLRTGAVAGGFRVAQVWRPAPAHAPGAARVSLRDTVRQIGEALFACLAAHETFWTARHGVEVLPTWGTAPRVPADPPAWDPRPLEQQARQGIQELHPLLAQVLRDGTMEAVTAAAGESGDLRLGDDTWVRAVIDFLGAARHRTMSGEHLAQTFVPLYFARAAAFAHETAGAPLEQVSARLVALGTAFERAKPSLVDRWTNARPGGSSGDPT